MDDSSATALLNRLLAQARQALPVTVSPESRPIASIDDINERYMDAFEQEHEGNLRNAMALFTILCKDIERAAEDENLSEETRIEYLRRAREYSDHMFALQMQNPIATGLNATTLRGVQSDDDGTSDAPEIVDPDLESYLQSIESSVQCSFYTNTIGFICAIMGIVRYFNDAGACDPALLQYMMIAYLPFAVIFLLAAYLMNQRLKEINHNPEGLDHETHRLWPKGSTMDKFDMGLRWISLLRTAWFFVAIIYVLPNVPVECTDSSIDDNGRPLYNMFLAVLIAGCLDAWINFLVITLLVLVLCCFSPFIYVAWREEQKKKPKGMNKKELKKLDTIKFTAGMEGMDEEAACSVCLMDFEEGETLRLLPCSGKHPFHQDCIDRWLVRNDTCPQCREHIMYKGDDEGDENDVSLLEEGRTGVD
uniref:RING-type domain-containing protein n=1 Tax=Aplanochytrium stocchinoi TaxID=215587 RepID=A0A6S8BMD5_9STRA|mmetsp:Transcript_10841/g.13570  ORF Transcript_10841/g.13570 Transcript_10841/m.13570 type:complete len:421 (-) Transcript_10841:723-1985(-)|eukprot:CAMPEP_0204830264 /NCGR_PEP_ID=MMETSP1346-20131115/8428_1 /ASSEMBLY_ACC=CAM_ASM_000771 /TAXON_ID=215587 /ORGANISM="Aplanochytrium stocchinoi, Strain GSBS06" /LENGTH=420 /DNA_ID=CAMNT_0051960427 /DNA_START=255 /DNA_END=1517 /DNA_ORIENTATION=-